VFAIGGRARRGPRRRRCCAYRRRLRATVQKRAGADRYAAQQIVRLAIERCQQLGLRQRGPRRTTLPKLRTALVRMARGYIASDALRMRL
jgi:hypothetical protein